ncbi:molybdopterin-guanine dinucleotide biosynthesis protein B [Melghirimyces profundicolus]|uniref:Molybdopterin-guanine dinucleotide biosynthesis protein B n=2 Tax=Melghirimyces profundicolus TaxID=1242148 RepID=A0A2T6BH13_9BACL|nr:molybdopterin-guanine dinucleotide biosynthesis protein B [Melghirimyces profundicolus]
MNDKPIPPVIQIVGYSNTGKTTLITRLIPLLSEEGWKVGTVKRHAGELELDEPGKDTWRHRESGADRVAITARNQTAVIFSRPLGLDELLEHHRGMDLVLVEGFKGASYPKLLMAGEEADLSLIRELTNVRGVVSPVPLEGKGIEVPQYFRDDTDGVAEVVKRLAGLKK